MNSQTVTLGAGEAACWGSGWGMIRMDEGSDQTILAVNFAHLVLIETT